MRYPLEIRLRPSKLILLLNAAIHAIAAFAFLRSSFPLPLVIVVVAGLGFSLHLANRAESEKAGGRLVLQDNGELSVDPDGRGQQTVYALAEPGCVDFGWAVWIHWRGTRVRRSPRRSIRGALMLVRGNVHEDEWRGLKIWLRHKVGPGRVEGAAENDATER
ncbi:protein YgfX [Aromatoleum petrolei]|uniref:Toxin CptA n=1 Tax=Aromatoleum petrolei TaxID=76116 RepID=A0ABX1MRN8_9RHOO|nr:protein YgfX [Aromatoleum petrolei]NMF89341.1 hypothetical protein [Aromatoleum petrolei]QTQ35171.1 Uncharacterized protein ToN1_09990 [Aromatoleum petrolei]